MVKTHPGLAPYLLRPSVTTQPMMAKIHGHQSEVARVYGVSPDQARVLLATVAFHCIAVADTVYSSGEEPAARPDRATEEAQVEAEFAQGMYALIVGTATSSARFDARSRRGNRPAGARAAGDGGVPLHRRGRHGVFGGWEEPAARPDRATEEAQVEAEFAQGMYALIVGALAVLEQREPFDPALFQARQ